MSTYVILQDVLEHLFKFGCIKKDMLERVRIGDRSAIKYIIENGVERNIVEEDENEIRLLSPLKLLLLLEEIGLETSQLSSYISWNEFENFIASKLYEFGWEYVIGYTHKRISRFQIDVIAMDFALKRALIVECKHWKKSLGVGSLRKIALNHIERVTKLTSHCEWVVREVPGLRSIENLIPIVITLKRGSVRVVEGVLVVSLHHLGDFLVNISSYIDSLNVKVFKNRCYV